MDKTPKSMRLQIGLFGRTNVGKSSFLNLVAGQDVAVTSEVPGTTTDVVEKAMELLPVGPVMFLDTGGIDDTTLLAPLRVQRTAKVFDRADVAVLVVEPNAWTDSEERILKEASQRDLPCVIVVNKTDLAVPSEAFISLLRDRTPHVVLCSSVDRTQRDSCVTAFKECLMELAPEELRRPRALVGDLLPPGGLAVLIVPIDLEAPKGRLILPQVQTIRDALDHGQAAVVVRESEYAALLGRLASPPDLVVCDSQVVDRMVRETPPGVTCTTFSILLARFKGDLPAMAAGAAALASLRPGDRVLIAEACSHHPLEDDIGRIKIPRWLRQFIGGDTQIDVCSGRDYPERLEDYAVIIHCGACMLTRKEMLNRLGRAQDCRVPITNYGVCISFLHDVLERVLSPFPEALDAFHRQLKQEEAMP